MSDMRLTSKQVKCSWCVNCISNSLRLQMDDPKRYDENAYSCKWCYVERINRDSDLLFAKSNAMINCIYAFRARYNKTFTDAIIGDFVKENVDRNKIMIEWVKEMERLSAIRDKKEVEKVGKLYSEEYFGKERQK